MYVESDVPSGRGQRTGDCYSTDFTCTGFDLKNTLGKSGVVMPALLVSRPLNAMYCFI